MDMNKAVAYIQIQIQIRYNLKKQQLNYGEITLSRLLRHTRLVKHKRLDLPAPFVILSYIAHVLQTATVCMLAHVSSLWTISDYGAYRKRLSFTSRVCRNNLESVISP